MSLDINELTKLLAASLEQNKILMDNNLLLSTENKAVIDALKSMYSTKSSTPLVGVQQVMGPVKFPLTFKSFTDLSCSTEKFEIWKQNFLSSLPAALCDTLISNKLSGHKENDKLLLDTIILGFGERVLDYSTIKSRENAVTLWLHINAKFNPISTAAYAKYVVQYENYVMDSSTDPEILFNRLQNLRDKIQACGDIITDKAYREKLFKMCSSLYPTQIESIKNMIAIKIDETNDVEKDEHILFMIKRLQALIQANYDAKDNNPKVLKVTTGQECPHCHRHHGTASCWLQQGIKCDNCGGVHPTNKCRKVIQNTNTPPIPGATTIPKISMKVTRTAMMVTNSPRTLNSITKNDGSVLIDPVAFTIRAPSNRFYVDSGCSDNMTPHKGLFESYANQIPTHANGAGGELAILGKGIVACLINAVQDTIVSQIESETTMLYVPGLSITLYSVKGATANGCKVVFYPQSKYTEKQCAGYIKLRNGYKVKLLIDPTVGLYYFDIVTAIHNNVMCTTVEVNIYGDSTKQVKPVAINKRNQAQVVKESDKNIISPSDSDKTNIKFDINCLSKRLGYVDERLIRRLSAIHNYTMEGVLLPPPTSVVVSNIKKSHIPRNPISHKYYPLQELQIDTGGPYIKSIEGNRYQYKAICRGTRISFVGFGTHLNAESICDWLEQLIVNEFPVFFKDTKVQHIMSDCHGGFESSLLGAMLVQRKIGQQFTTPHTAESRGVVEQSITQGINKAITLMNNAQLYGPYRKCWQQAVAQSNVIRLILPCRYIKDNVSPLVRNGNIDIASKYVQHLRTFGCLAVIHIEKLSRTKFDDRGNRALYLGFALNRFGAHTGVFLNLETNVFPIYSRHFQLFENKTIFDTLNEDPTIAPQAQKFVNDLVYDEQDVKDTFQVNYNLEYLQAVVNANALRYENRIIIDNVNFENNMNDIINVEALEDAPAPIVPPENEEDSHYSDADDSHEDSDPNESDLAATPDNYNNQRENRNLNQDINYADYNTGDSDYTDNDNDSDEDYDPESAYVIM